MTLSHAAIRSVLGLAVTAMLPAQDVSRAAFTRALENLPASTFVKPTVGIRGMQLNTVNKIDPRLRDLVDQSRRGASVRARSVQLGATAADVRVPVTTSSSDARQSDALAQEMRSQGGEIVATYDTTIWALMPPASIERIAASSNLAYISVQNRVEQTQLPTQAPSRGLASSENSLRATGVEALQKAGIRGRGVKIGIIDFGFGSYKKMQQAGKVAVPKMVHTFPESFPLENDSLHGTACAEIIYDMAPEADIYLASAASNEGSVIAAAKWLISQGVDVISASIGSTEGPSDGSSDWDRFVDSSTRDKGVVWIVSAGNSGGLHWFGKNKANENGFIEVTPGEVGIRITPFTDEVTITVRWNDWGPNPRHPTSTQDIDALLVIMRNGTLEVVGKGIEVQNGDGRPEEHIHLEGKGVKGQTYTLLLKNTKVTRSLDVHVFVAHTNPAKMDPEIPARSVGSPASASYAVGVGAWDINTNAVAEYSSQGPTDDNRLKPEIAAPAGIPSATTNRPFYGTSAACPHVAGFAALLKQSNPQLRGLGLRDALLRSVAPKGATVPNMESGYGWIDGKRIPTQDAPLRPPTNPMVPPQLVRPVDPLKPAPSNGVPDRSVPLPIAWGGSVPAAYLEQLRAPQGQTPDFLVRVITGRDLYRFGDGLKVGLRTGENAAYLLFHRAVTGEYTLLSPRGETAGTLTAGVAYFLPSDEETFQVTPPSGIEELLLICSRQPIDLKQTALSGGVPGGLVIARHSYRITN